MQKTNQDRAPIFDALQKLSQKKPVSFHVPGHKNGKVFSSLGRDLFQDILKFDATELSGLDDLHAPDGVIDEAQRLAAKWFGAEHTFFLVGGSTAGNLAAVMSVCAPGDKVIVQRNCHKSVLNGLELSGADPVFVAPAFEKETGRYNSPGLDTIKEAIEKYPEAKAIILTYPDYFGSTYDIRTIIRLAHSKGLPVVVDEAHGVHFSLGSPFPPSALDLGADIVVQSAHKMAPAMTMASLLHVNSSVIDPAVVNHYLQIIQSSSPSYPLMASLDLARRFLALMTSKELSLVQESVDRLRKELAGNNFWKVVPARKGVHDPLKVTIHVTAGYTGHKVAKLFEAHGIYPELSSNDQVLFLHGLTPFDQWHRLEEAVKKVKQELKFTLEHDIIETNSNLFAKGIQTLVVPYKEMRKKDTLFVKWENAVDCIAAEAIIPYPPGIPILMAGEKITLSHMKMINYLWKQGTNFQNSRIDAGIEVFDY